MTRVNELLSAFGGVGIGVGGCSDIKLVLGDPRSMAKSSTPLSSPTVAEDKEDDDAWMPSSWSIMARPFCAKSWS